MRREIARVVEKEGRNGRGVIYAHDWGILGEDRIKRWQEGPYQCREKRGKGRSVWQEKRPVKVQITTYIGTIAINASHYYVKVEEAKNQWWCEERNAWVELSCDTSYGYNLSANVYTQQEAIQVALRFLETVCGPKRDHHTVTWHGPGRPRWASQ